MPLTSLPSELLIIIGKNLIPRHLSPFLRANRRIFHLLTPFFREFAFQGRYTAAALICAAVRQDEVMIRHLLEKGEDIKIIEETPDGEKIIFTDNVVFTATSEYTEEVVAFVLEHGANLILEDRYFPWDFQGRNTILYTHSNGEPWPSETKFKHVYDRRDDLDDDIGNNVPFISRYDPGLEVESRTALQWTIAHRHDRLFKTLLENGAKFLCVNKRGRTAINEAVLRNNYTAVELLIEKGADINISDDFGRTPLHYAAYSGNEAMVRLLIGNGANITAWDKGGEMALMLAGRTTMDRTFLREKTRERMQQEVDQHKSFYAAVMMGDVAGARHYLRLGCNVDWAYRYGPLDMHSRAIVEAAKRGYVEMVKLLLEYRARDFIDQYGRRALQVAMRQKPPYDPLPEFGTWDTEQASSLPAVWVDQGYDELSESETSDVALSCYFVSDWGSEADKEEKLNNTENCGETWDD